MEEKLTVIDLNQKDKLNEFNWLKAFGSGVKTILAAMFGADKVKNPLQETTGEGTVPIQIRGTPDQVRTFASVLGKEKDYMSAWRKYGLDDARTYRSKGKLDVAIDKFQRTTGIQWPFK